MFLCLIRYLNDRRSLRLWLKISSVRIIMLVLVFCYWKIFDKFQWRRGCFSRLLDHNAQQNYSRSFGESRVWIVHFIVFEFLICIEIYFLIFFDFKNSYIVLNKYCRRLTKLLMFLIRILRLYNSRNILFDINI